MHTPTYGTGSIEYTVSSPNELVTLYEHLHETNQLPRRLDSKHYSAPSRLAWYRYHPDIKSHPQKVEYRLTLSIYPTNQPATHISETTEGACTPSPEALHRMIQNVAHRLNETGLCHFVQVTNPSLREELYPVHRASFEAKYIYADARTPKTTKPLHPTPCRGSNPSALAIC